MCIGTSRNSCHIDKNINWSLLLVIRSPKHTETKPNPHSLDQLSLPSFKKIRIHRHTLNRKERKRLRFFRSLVLKNLWCRTRIQATTKINLAVDKLPQFQCCKLNHPDAGPTFSSFLPADLNLGGH